MRFSIVIPCFNEAATLPTLLSKCSEVVARSDQKLEFIIVDNGSTDETSQIIDKMIMSSPGCHSIRRHKRGLWQWNIEGPRCSHR